MKQVTVNKQELKEILIKNRTEHRDIFTAALARYREELAKVLEEQLALLKDNKPANTKKITALTEPKDFTKEYDRAIKMLDMETAPHVVLDYNDFRRLVQDEWDWSHAWAVSNSRYTSSSKFDPYVNDL